MQILIYLEEQELCPCLHAEDIAECDYVIKDQTIPKDTRFLVASKETLQVDDTSKIFFELLDPRALGIVVVPHRVPNIVLIGQAVAFHYEEPWLLAVGHDHRVDLGQSIWQLVGLNTEGKTMTEHRGDSIVVLGVV